MPTRRAAPKPPEEEVVVDEGAGDQDGLDGDRGDRGGNDVPTGDSHLRQIVREVVADVLGGDGFGDGDNAPGDGGEGGGRLIDEERRVEQRVRAELERIGAANDIAGLKEQVKAIVEKPPVKWRRSTRVMGWVDEDDR